MKAFEVFRILLDFVAVYRLTKLVIDDEIVAEIREKIWDKFPPESTKIGYLLTCPWCVSFWMAVAIVTTRKINPEIADYISGILAASAVTGIAISKGL